MERNEHMQDSSGGNGPVAGRDPLQMTVEEFGALEAMGHQFGEKYEARKAALLESLDGQSGWEAQAGTGARAGTRAGRSRRRLSRVAVAAIAAVCVALPVAAYAAVSHAGFFDGAFGTGMRESAPAVEGVQDQGGEKEPVKVVYPASDVVPVDQEMAEALLGAAVCDTPVHVSSPDGHELTIEAAVRSEDTLAYRFTLHRDGGVTALEWNDQTNNVAAKGAYMPHDQQFGWYVAGDSFVYVDPHASTQDTLVGYGYSVLGSPVPAGQPVSMLVYTWDVPANNSTEDQFHMDTYQIPCTQVVASETFANAAGGQVRLSPLGLVLDMGTGLFAPPAQDAAADGGEVYDMAQEPIWVRSITVRMADGQDYVLLDQGANLNNSLSACQFDSQFSLAFNRLVDPAQVEGVDVCVVDVANPDELLDANGDWPAPQEWPVKTVSYMRA